MFFLFFVFFRRQKRIQLGCTFIQAFPSVNNPSRCHLEVMRRISKTCLCTFFCVWYCVFCRAMPSVPPRLTSCLRSTPLFLISPDPRHQPPLSSGLTRGSKRRANYCGGLDVGEEGCRLGAKGERRGGKNRRERENNN